MLKPISVLILSFIKTFNMLSMLLGGLYILLFNFPNNVMNIAMFFCTWYQ